MQSKLVIGDEGAGVTTLMSENQKLRERLLQAEQFHTALENSEKRYRGLFENAIDLIQIVAPDGQILFVNEAWRHKFGYKQDEISGLSIFDLIAPDFTEHCQATFMTVMSEGKVENLTTTFVKKDGSTVELKGNAQCTYDLSGKPVSSQCIFQDVTAIKAHEAEELRSERIESLGIIAGGLAHDFNNFLTAILGNISLARVHAASDSETARCLLRAEKASMRAQGLARQLLMFSKGSASVMRTVRLADVIRESAEFASRGSRIRVDFELAKDLWIVEVDAGQISQTIHNLVINAAQAMPSGGKTEIRALNLPADRAEELGLPRARYLQVEVEDHGCGISEEGLQRLFDPYYTTKAAGTGLGLAVTQSVIQNHGGEIRVKSEVGEGTTVAFYLPTSESSVVDEDRSTVDVPKGTSRVLVLDDDRMIREMISEMLSTLGYDVDAVSDGVSAIRLYRKAQSEGSPFKVLILDLTVPGGLGGEQVLNTLRDENNDIKAIISSGYAREPGALADIEAGSASYLQKPYDLGTLARMMRKVIDED